MRRSPRGADRDGQGCRDELDEGVIDLVEVGGLSDDVQLRAFAVAALARVAGESSEWQELWLESESSQEADDMLAGLRAAAYRRWAERISRQHNERGARQMRMFSGALQLGTADRGCR